MFKSLLSKAAPFLGSLIGGPAGAAVGSLVGKVLTPGVKNPTEEQLTTALEKATPEQLILLKKEEAKLKERIAQIEHENNALLVGDTQDARKMNLESKDKTPAFLAYCILLGFFGMIIGLFIDDKIPEGSSKVIFSLAGTITTLLVCVFNFYFGRTSFTKDK